MDDRHYATSGTIGVAAALIFFSATLLSVPLHLFEGLVPTPFLPLVLIFLYGLDRPSSLPPLVTFLGGLYLDLLLGTAIGPWAVVFLLVHASVLSQRSYFVGRDSVVLTTGFVIALIGALIVYWAAMSVISARPMPAWPLVYQGIVTVVAFPAVLFLFRRTIARQSVSLAA